LPARPQSPPRMVSPALVFFGRHPTPGKCKSRLARSVGSDDAAAFIYDAIVRVVLLRATLSRVERDETAGDEQTRVIFTCAAEDDVAPCRALLERGGRWYVDDDASSTSTAIDVRAQTQVDDLGARLVDAFRVELENARARGARDPPLVCVAGTDIPAFSFAHARMALERARDERCVTFGPSRDGGFYCVAATATPDNCDKLSRAFADVVWSSSDTLAQCVANCKAEGMIVRVDMETLQDVDDARDLERALAEGERPERPEDARYVARLRETYDEIRTTLRDAIRS